MMVSLAFSPTAKCRFLRAEPMYALTSLVITEVTAEVEVAVANIVEMGQQLAFRGFP